MLQNPRLNRLFSSDHRCFDLAIDHGVFHNPEFLAGIEDLPAAVARAVEAGPDAIQLGPGQARLLQSLAGRKPAMVLRGDVANVYGPNLPPQLFCITLADAVEQAAADAAAIVPIFSTRRAGTIPVPRQSAAASLVQRYGMPLMVEPGFEEGPRGNFPALPPAGDRRGASGSRTGRRPDQERSAHAGLRLSPDR
jgi:DhnA family fructose-bisphosphate aldolase class Ia